jgi:formylglycine-generating enzyme required for sulfatase activity
MVSVSRLGEAGMAGEAIFVSYRRDDTADVAARMHDALSRRFGRRRIFMDVDNLPPGADFGEYIRTVLPSCRVALVLIGPSWLEARDDRGGRRLDDPNDWVRVEIETGLTTPGLDVVPVLVNGATMPHPEQVAESLRPLLRRHAAIIRRNPDFHDDVGRLIAALRVSVRTGVLDFSSLTNQRKASSSRVSPWWTIVGMAALALLILIWQPWRSTPASNGPANASKQESSSLINADQESLRDGQTFRDCDSCPEMVVVPGGAFTMGSPEHEASRDPDETMHRVSLDRFAIARTEITRGQYAEFSRATGRRDGANCAVSRGPGTWRDPGLQQEDSHPVVCVSWTDASAYVQWLSGRTGRDYRLPSEVEWEHAARAGTTTAYSTGQAIFATQASFGRTSGTEAVASYEPNAFGLFDMHGSTWEWVADCYTEDVSELPLDGSVFDMQPCLARVYRGGGWDYVPERGLRSANRERTAPDDRGVSIGFRVARSLS